MEDHDQYLSIGMAAELKKCSRTTIYHLIKRGKINTREIAGKKFVVRDEDFEAVRINRGVPFARLEERLTQLEVLVAQLEERNKKLEDKVSKLESLRAGTKVRKK